MKGFVSQSLKRLFLFVGIVLMVYQAGCTNVPSSTETLSPASITSFPITMQPTDQGIPVPTNTPYPVVTLSPTVVASSPVPTLIPLSPLTGEEALIFIARMQETNGDCELPCWWGITPGETTEQVAKGILSPLTNFKGLRSDIGFHLESYSDIDVSLYTGDENRIAEIWVISSIRDSDQSARYHPSWQRYFVDEMFARLGMPSQVWLGFGPHTGDHDERPPESIPYFYELYVIYSDLGLIVRYAGPAIKGNPDRACLSFEQLKDTRIFTQQHSKGPLIGPPWEPFTDARPMPEITDLSLEAFYEAVRNTKDPVCIESPAKFWP